MLAQIQNIAAQYGISTPVLLMIGVGIGVLLIFSSVISAFRDRNVAADRIASTNGRGLSKEDRNLLRGPEFDPKGIMRTIVPADEKERSELQLKLAQAGFPQAGAMRNFILVRVFLGIVLPAIFLFMIFYSKVPGNYLPGDWSQRIAGYSNFKIFQNLSILVAGGYYLPLIWLNGRVKERRQRVEEAFPNALDLMQISVEAGLGFDAAMTRVGNELASVSPDIAFEFLTVQRQVQAGRERERAMRDMARRTGVETVKSFANVVQQSMQFGTPMSDALQTYANEMREYRETKAQEMANKLPVKMSAVLAGLMLPALILLTVGPVIIRYTAMFSN